MAKNMEEINISKDINMVEESLLASQNNIKDILNII